MQIRAERILKKQYVLDAYDRSFGQKKTNEFDLLDEGTRMKVRKRGRRIATITRTKGPRCPE
jgi:hypothetical protein